MKQLYFTIILLVAAFAANSQNNFAKESKQKMQEFLQKFPAQELKSATADANALDSITFENGGVKKMTYNSSGLLLTYKYYKNEADKINLYETETNTYNESGQMLTNVVGMYDDWAKKVIDQSKYENTYNAQGRPVTEIEWDAGNDAPYALEYDSKTTYTYTDDGTVETMTYDWDNDQWKEEVKQTMFVRWDAGTYPMVDSLYAYILKEGTSDEWYRAAKMTLTYSVDGQMSGILTIGYMETGEERSNSKSVTTYNAIGNTLMETSEIYNPQTMVWDLITKTEYEYNTDNQIIREENFNVAWTAGILAPISRITYDYDSDGNLETQKEYLYYGEEELIQSYKNDFTFKNLDTKNIMLPSSYTGIFGNYTDFYDVEFYENGAIDEVEHYSYSYTDTETNEMLEKTGKYHYSEHNSIGTSVEQLNNASNKVFPNPFSNEINLKLDIPGDYILRITNVTGQIVYTSNVEATVTSHNASSFPSGMYIISLSQNGEYKGIYKLIKE